MDFEDKSKEKEKLGLIIESAFKILVILRKYTDLFSSDNDENDKGNNNLFRLLLYFYSNIFL